MENHSDRPKYIWEYFVDTPWDNEKCKRSPIEQIILLDMDVSFEESLYLAGFTIEEITQVIAEDTQLRVFTN